VLECCVSGSRARACGRGRDYKCDNGVLSVNKELPLAPSALLTKNISVWCRELANGDNKDFLIDGIRYGFMIIDRVCELSNCFRRNYGSVLHDNRDLVELQILKEIRLGRYVKVSTPPRVVSSLGAVPKSNGKIRLIHDLSQPDGGINRFGVNSSVTYATIDDALKRVVPGTFMAKIDLS
jgi:hypothetical protein